MIDLSIIIVNYNVSKLSKQCIDSIVKTCSNLDFEIILVDNFSPERNIVSLVEVYPDIKFLQLDRNYGFAGANNRGSALAQGRYILFLNPDTIVLGGALKRMIDFLDSNLNVGIVGPKLYLNSDKQYHPLYDEFTSPAKLLLSHVPGYRIFSRIRNETLRWKDSARSVDWVCGAALMIKREIWEQVGMFDERFFMYCEDQDLCLRAHKQGCDVFYLPNAKIIHYGGASSKQVNKMSIKYYWESKLFFLEKYTNHDEVQYFKKRLCRILKCKILLRINPVYNKAILQILYSTDKSLMPQ